MDFSASFKICSDGLQAQRTRMDVITSNIANAETTRTAEGGPYKRKTAVLSSEPLANSFGETLNNAVMSVKVEKIVEDNGVKMVYDPKHPDANPEGYVAKPNINLMLEMAEMITASRNYEACVTALDATKNMTLKTLDIGK
ncbi:MAG: flagellar basal body rod protein FlgC [Syntrophales bacterium]|jgi:flagellar basal-body rod protein FlgC|nr:flagellar basal body rod protein FlgC [Syntrophales bacterium]